MDILVLNRDLTCQQYTQVLEKLFQSVPLNDDTPYSGSLDT
jgi:hypothetical protein